MNYVVKRNNIFYIRKIIPSAVQKIVGTQRREIIKSLHTADYTIAVRRAAPIIKQIENIFEQLSIQFQLTELRNLMTSKKETVEPVPELPKELKIDKIRTLPDGTLEIEGLDFDSNNLENENAAFEQIVATVQKRSPKQQNVKDDTAILLSDLIDKHIRDKFASEEWSPFEAPGIEKKLRRFLEVVGDLPITSYTIDHAQRFQEFVNKLPLRAGNLSVEEIMSGEAKTRISTNTKNSWFIYISGMFNWAVKKNVSGLSHNIFSGLMVAKKKRADVQRRATTDQEIHSILNYLNTFDDEHPSDYWGFRIGAYSGMRAGEICQLLTSDVQEINGVWCFNVNEENNKRVKTENSIRVVPIHSELLNLNFLEYVKSRSGGNGLKKLFPDCVPYGDKAAHGFSKDFGRLKKKLIKNKILPTSSKDMTFHGLRHSCATKLRDAEVSETRVAEILGHERGLTMSFKRYSKVGNVDKLREAVEKIKY